MATCWTRFIRRTYGENIHFIVQLSRSIFFTLLFYKPHLSCFLSSRIQYSTCRSISKEKKRKYPPVWYQWANTCWWFYYFGTRLICNSAQFTHFFLLKIFFLRNFEIQRIYHVQWVVCTTWTYFIWVYFSSLK